MSGMQVETGTMRIQMQVLIVFIKDTAGIGRENVQDGGKPPKPSDDPRGKTPGKSLRRRMGASSGEVGADEKLELGKSKQRPKG